MLVLVSVRSADEVAAAVAGGADVIDAKEPDRGPLGPVSAPTLAAIARAVPAACAFSVALGDPAGPVELAEAFGGVRQLPACAADLVLKIGLARLGGRPALDALLECGLQLSGTVSSPARLMAVASVDHGPTPDDVTDAAASAGIDGVVLDTWRKDGRDLFDWLDDPALVRWIERTRSRGLRTGLAGSLSQETIGRAARLGPDMVGVRGAACLGGRCGRVDEGLVRSLVAAARSAFAPRSSTSTSCKSTS
jgi:uncharacterized protein (UPF0264 family)